MIHVSSHGAVLNSAALRAVGISAQTPTPAGGQIVRKPGSQEPAGLIMETAFFAAAAKLPQPSAEQMLEALRAAQLHYAANGYTTIQDGATSAAQLALLQRAAAEERLFLDVVALPDARTFAGIVGKPGITFGGAYQGHLKLGGVKSIVDGSAQARTAFFSEPMKVPGPAGQRAWRGVPILSQAELEATFRLAYQNNVQTYTHANGDAAIDMVLAAHEAAGAPQGRRPVIIHSQFVRPEQLNSYARIGAVPSFFTNHAFFWGDVHVKNLGQARAFVPLAAALGDHARAALHQPQRLRGDAARPDVHPLDRHRAHLALGRGDRARRARERGRGAARDHDRRRLPVFRGGHQGLDRARQARRLRDPRPQSAERHRRCAARDPRARDDQGRRDRLHRQGRRGARAARPDEPE